MFDLICCFHGILFSFKMERVSLQESGSTAEKFSSSFQASVKTDERKYFYLQLQSLYDLSPYFLYLVSYLVWAPNRYHKTGALETTDIVSYSSRD